MRKGLAIALLLALTACDRSSRAPAPVASTSASSKVTSTALDAAEMAKATKRAERVAKCVGNVAQSETIWADTCLVRDLPLDVVDHVPRIAPRGTLHAAAATLSFSLAMDFESAAYRPTLLLHDGDRVAVLGMFEARGGSIAVPAAGTLALDDKSRISAARLWFDQRVARGQVTGRPSADAGVSAALGAKLRIVVAKRDAAEAARLAVFGRALAATREGKTSALAGLYAETATLHDLGPGTRLRGAHEIAALLGRERVVDVDRRWAAGNYVVAELRRRGAAGPATASLEVMAFDAGRISEHWLFRNRLRADLAAGLAQPPPARNNAASVRAAGSPTLLEGLPHPGGEAELLAAEKQKRVLELHGHPFYTERIEPKAADAVWLTELLVDATALRPFSGEKKCGGFHPDFAVRWQHGAKRYDALVCFGCGELKWIVDGKSTRYDMAHWARLNLETALRGYRNQRP